MCIMSRPRILPSDRELVWMRDQGMTHQQIADEVSRKTGHRIARSTVSVALARAGESDHRRRFRDTIPWQVPTRFQAEYPLRMLRLLGRQRRGMVMTDDERTRLESWMSKRQSEGSVVVFCPDVPRGEPGFYYVPDTARDHDDDELPIRVAEVSPKQIGFE